MHQLLLEILLIVYRLFREGHHVIKGSLFDDSAIESLEALTEGEVMMPKKQEE